MGAYSTRCVRCADLTENGQLTDGLCPGCAGKDRELAAAWRAWDASQQQPRDGFRQCSAVKANGKRCRGGAKRGDVLCGPHLTTAAQLFREVAGRG